MTEPHSFRARAWTSLALVLALLPCAGAPQSVSQGVPKQVHLVVDGKRLMASNVRLNTFHELDLGAQERVRDQRVGEAVIVVVTNQRILGYGVLSGWRGVDRVPNEQIESLSAEDYAGLIVTSERMLNFNGETGVWGERKRRVSH
jgi:hypothetical protein